MTQPLNSIPAPSLSTLTKGTGIALLVAAVLLVTVVLPAEYGIDPLGTGKALGLSQLAATSTVGPDVAPAAGGPLTVQPASYKVDAIEFTLMPEQAMEYKYQLKEGATMLYAWKATGAVELDFHTEPEGKPSSASDSFERNASSVQGRGSYRAPYTGIHGWYWKNTTDKSVTITLQTAGFYTGAFMFGDGGSKEAMEVMDPPPPPTY